MMTNNVIERMDSGKLDPVTPVELPIMIVVVLLSSCLAVFFSYLGRALHYDIHSANYVMIFLTGVLFVSCRSSRTTALICSLLSVLSYDFFFVKPYYSLVPSDRQYFIVVLFMFLVSLTVNELAYRARVFAKRANLLEQEAETEKLKNTLLRSVSHDLKSPLTAIMGAATLLGDDTEEPLSDELKKELALSIAVESSRLNRIVSNLLDMTRLESGGIALHKDWYHFDELLANSIASIETRYGAQDIEVILAESMPLLFVDPLLIEQLLTNILDNCVKYAPKSRYQIIARVVANDLVVYTHNKGQSLDDSGRVKLFAKFYRGDTTQPGAGLGLSICQSVVLLHGGKIWFEPEIKDGVTLTFELPLPSESPLVELEEEAAK